MSQIIKSFLGVFLILFLTLCCFGIFGSYLSVTQAQNVHARAINELEDSDYNRNVMATLFEETKEMGYDLSITLYGAGMEDLLIQKAEDIPTDTKSYNRARVEMHFRMSMPIFQIGEEHTLVAYTR